MAECLEPVGHDEKHKHQGGGDLTLTLNATVDGVAAPAKVFSGVGKDELRNIERQMIEGTSRLLDFEHRRAQRKHGHK